VGEHPFEAVRRFPHILKHHDRAPQIREMGGAEQVGRHREIGHQQWAFTNPPDPAIPLQGRDAPTE
jgi:hypothetical protein